MKKKTITLVTYALLAVAIFASVFFFIRSTELQKELDATRSEVKSEYESYRTTLYNQLIALDTLISKGNYGDAHLTYGGLLSELQVEGKFSKVVDSQTGFIHDMEDMRERLSFFEGEEPLVELTEEITAKEQQIDSLSELLTLQKRMQGDQLDSLSFALEKAQTRARSLTDQLGTRSKSNREYLKFNNSEGVEIHYVGEVKDNKAQGKGVALYSTGCRYEGEWEDNQRHGEGVFFWPDGEHYKGKFYLDERNGQGEYYWPNGEMFSGEWKDDKRNGKGIFYGKNGETVVSGTWQNNELIDKNKQKGK